MKAWNLVGNALAGGKRQKGEKQKDYNERAHQAYITDWMMKKISEGKWLPLDEWLAKKKGK